MGAAETNRFAAGWRGLSLYRPKNTTSMSDAFFIVLSVVFFAVSVAYAHFCEKGR